MVAETTSQADSPIKRGLLESNRAAPVSHLWADQGFCLN